MMFGKSGFYSIYIKSEDDDPFAEMETVKSGFNFWAFLFNGFWAIYNKCWFLLLTIFLIQMLFVISIKFALLSEELLNILSLIFNIWIGFEANNYKEESIKRKGYSLFDIVYARDSYEAKLRFIDKYNNNQAANKDLSTKPSERIIFDDVDLESSNSVA